MLEGGIFNGQALSPEKGFVPDTNEVTHLLDNQFAILQHLEGQVEFYKVSVHINSTTEETSDSKTFGKGICQNGEYKMSYKIMKLL